MTTFSKMLFKQENSYQILAERGNFGIRSIEEAILIFVLAVYLFNFVLQRVRTENKQITWFHQSVIHKEVQGLVLLHLNVLLNQLGQMRKAELLWNQVSRESASFSARKIRTSAYLLFGGSSSLEVDFLSMIIGILWLFYSSNLADSFLRSSSGLVIILFIFDSK